MFLLIFNNESKQKLQLENNNNTELHENSKALLKKKKAPQNTLS